MNFLLRLLVFYLLFNLLLRVISFFAKLFLRRTINPNKGAANREYSRPNRRPVDKRNVINAEFEEIE